MRASCAGRGLGWRGPGLRAQLLPSSPHADVMTGDGARQRGEHGQAWHRKKETRAPSPKFPPQAPNPSTHQKLRRQSSLWGGALTRRESAKMSVISVEGGGAAAPRAPFRAATPLRKAPEAPHPSNTNTPESREGCKAIPSATLRHTSYTPKGNARKSREPLFRRLGLVPPASVWRPSRAHGWRMRYSPYRPPQSPRLWRWSFEQME